MPVPALMLVRTFIFNLLFSYYCLKTFSKDSGRIQWEISLTKSGDKEEKEIKIPDSKGICG